MSEEVRREQVSSVTLSRNAKGIVQPEVKVYDPDPDKASKEAVRIFDELAAKYPQPVG